MPVPRNVHQASEDVHQDDGEGDDDPEVPTPERGLTHAEVGRWLEARRWIYARSRPTNPHEYTLRREAGAGGTRDEGVREHLWRQALQPPLHHLLVQTGNDVHAVVLVQAHALLAPVGETHHQRLGLLVAACPVIEIDLVVQQAAAARPAVRPEKMQPPRNVPSSAR